MPRTEAPASRSACTAPALRGLDRGLVQPGRVAGADPVAGDGVEVLHRDAVAAEGAVGRRGQQRIADHPPDPGVERRRRDSDVGGGDRPPVRRTHPQLGLLAAAAALELGDRDHQGVVVVDGLDVGLHDPPLRGTAPRTAERADHVVADEQPGRVAAQRARPGCEQPVQGREVVGHQRALVVPERLDQTVGCGRGGHRRTSAKSDFRIRACTPLTTSTTWEMSKSVAADR